MRRALLILAIIVVELLTNQFVPKQQSPDTSTEITKEASSTASLTGHNSALVRVIRVIDGDTIEIEGGDKVRYIGIDSPETVDPRQSVMCFGKEASAQNRSIVEGKTVRLEKDVSDTDKFGRLLRYVYAGDLFVNDYLVRQGFAYASTYPPDVKYADVFTDAQKEARLLNRGLWSECVP